MAIQETMAPAPLKPSQPPTSRVAKAIRGKIPTPFKAVIYGTESVGKSTTAAAMPRPIFFDLEDGTARLNVARYSFHDEASGHVARSYDQILEGVRDLQTAEHDFATLVIDSASALESLIHRHIIARDKGKLLIKSIEDYGYGKGYAMTVEVLRQLLAEMDILRAQRGMNVAILGHAHIKAARNPQGDDFDRYIMRTNERFAGALIEWADLVGFAHFEEGATGGKGKGVTTGRRIMHFHRSLWDAKSRFALPEFVEMNASDPWSRIDAVINATPEELVANIHKELKRIANPELSAKVQAAVLALDESKSEYTERLSAFLVSLRDR